MRPRTLNLWLLGIASTPLVLILLIVVFTQVNDLQLRIRGYHVMSTGWELGEILATKGEPANECLKFRSPTFDFMTPSRGEHIGMCVRKYAELKKDPSACELLMPSSYGLSCVGEAIAARKTCNLNEDTVSWWEDEENEIAGRVSFESCQGDDASGTVKRNQCCLIARVTRVRGQDDCSPLANDRKLQDECIAGLAFKNRDPNTCSEIHDTNLRSACTVRTKAMKENPTICDGCREPVNNLSELK